MHINRGEWGVANFEVSKPILIQQLKDEKTFFIFKVNSS